MPIRDDGKRAKLRRDSALRRPELRGGTHEPRIAAAGPTSLAVKVIRPEIRAMIDEALARKRQSVGPGSE